MAGAHVHLRSEAGLAALAVVRRLAARRGALAATAAVTLAAAYFAVRVAVAWDVTLPSAAMADLRALPDAAVVAVNASNASAPPCGPAASTLPPDARAAVDEGGFGVEAMTTSDSLSLAALPGAAPESSIKAYCAPSVRDHAVLTAGTWPGPAAPGAPIPATLPADTLAALKLHIGARFTTTSATSHAKADLLIVGSFQRSQNPAGWWAWNLVGPSGLRIVGSYAEYDQMVVDPSAFATGALHADSSTLLVLPPSDNAVAGDLGGLNAQATTITNALASNPAPYYALSGELTTDLKQLDQSVTTAQAQLLAASLLLGTVTAVGLIAATGLLVGIGAAQSALNRARGAGREHLLGAHWPEMVVLCVAAVAAVPIGALFTGGSGPADTSFNTGLTAGAAWAGAAATAVLAVAVLCIRALRSELPSEVAAASARQAPLAYGLRIGADLVLAALAGIALWQASGSPLTASGPNGGVGADIVVAAAPALAVAAAAALTGRLVPAVARLAERGAARARRLATVFALWQVGRTPLGYVLPALVSVAAVAGGTFAVAQSATWQRSAHDQGSFNVGAPVSVTMPWTAAPGQAEAVARRPGVLAATPVQRLPGSQGGSLLAVDSATAPDTVLLRSDLAGEPAATLWRQLGSSPATGIQVPGRPTRIEVSAQLYVKPPGRLDPAQVLATAEDASGLVYQLHLGDLPADGRPHALAAPLSTANPPNYPLRLLRIDVSYIAPPSADANAELSVSLPFASGDQLGKWLPFSSWDAGTACPTGASASDGSGPNPNPPPQTNAVTPGANGGATLAFSTGAGLDLTVTGPCIPIPATVSLSADSGKSTINAVATSSFLSSAGTSVGSTVPISIAGATVPAHIVAAVSAFPTVPAGGPGGLIVDLPTAAAAIVEQGGVLFPPTEWWLSTADAAIPAGLPPGSSATTAAALGDTLSQDPLTATAPHLLTVGAIDLVLLAALALAACLAAAGRRQSAHEPVLAALGAGRRQRTAIRLLLNIAIVVPAALLGWGLGLLVARRLVPAFVLTPSGAAPLPPAILTTRPVWSAAAVLVLLAVGVLAALDLRLRLKFGKRRRTRHTHSADAA